MAKQFSIINDREIPLVLHLKNDSIYQISCSMKKILEKLIPILDPINAHKHDIISTHMLQICGESKMKLHKIIYKQSFHRKERNCVLVLMKNDKQLLKSY